MKPPIEYFQAHIILNALNKQTGNRVKILWIRNLNLKGVLSVAKETLLFQVKTTREWILETFDKVSVEDMTKIPEGFRNNIHWQLGHVAGMMELPTAALTDSKSDDGKRFQKYFGYGTGPDDFDDETPSIEEIKALLEGQVPRLEDITEESLDEDLPREFMGMTKRNEQLSFMILHEALHAGKIQEMSKLIK